MAFADRQTTTDLANTLLAEAHQHNFFQLLERLHGLHGDDLEPQRPIASARQRVWLRSDACLSFPASDIRKAERMMQTSDGQRYNVCATFFGLHGTDSPLPGFYLDQVAYEQTQGIGIRPAFLDFFNHYLLSLLHRSWRKYRYYIRFQAQANDDFSRYVFALIGLNDGQLRGNTALPWGRLLSFAGVIASRSRAPGTVAGIIALCFDLPCVQIREFEARSLRLDPRQMLSLGRQNGHLGNDFTVGTRTRTRSSKFTLVISQLTQVRLREFLPSGEHFERIRALIDFLLRDGLAYDLELVLKDDEVPAFCLSRNHGTHLGWTSFIEIIQGQCEGIVRIKVRS